MDSIEGTTLLRGFTKIEEKSIGNVEMINNQVKAEDDLDEFGTSHRIDNEIHLITEDSFDKKIPPSIVSTSSSFPKFHLQSQLMVVSLQLHLF